MGPLWRLLRDAPADGAANMARDEALLTAAARGAPPTLRLYAWTRPTLSLGAHQRAADADLAACRRLGVDLVRRPTGGGAVLHHVEVTYAVAGRLGEPPFLRSVVALYDRIGAALIAALSRLGVHAEASRDGAGRAQVPEPSRRSPAHCFGAPSSRELLAGGRKLVGSAQVRRRGAFLQHGSILMDLDEALLVQVLPAARREPWETPPGGRGLRAPARFLREADAEPDAANHLADPKTARQQAEPAPPTGLAAPAPAAPTAKLSPLIRPTPPPPAAPGLTAPEIAMELSTPPRATEPSLPPQAIEFVLPPPATELASPPPATLRELTGRSLSREEVEECIVAGFAATFEIGLEPSRYDPVEQEEAARLRAFKYLDARWTLEGKMRSPSITNQDQAGAEADHHRTRKAVD